MSSCRSRTSRSATGELGWQGALLWTGALLPFAIVAWLLSIRSRPRDGGSSARRRRTGIWADPVAWQVLLYMGLQSSIFYMLVTWFAPIAHSLGRSEVVAGVDVMIYQLCAIAGSLTIPLLLRGRMQRVGPAAIPVLSLVGILGLIALPGAFLLWVDPVRPGVGRLARGVAQPLQPARAHPRGRERTVGHGAVGRLPHRRGRARSRSARC